MPRKLSHIPQDQTIFTNGIFIQPNPPTYNQLQEQVDLWQKRSAKALAMGIAIGCLCCYLAGRASSCRHAQHAGQTAHLTMQE